MKYTKDTRKAYFTLGTLNQNRYKFAVLFLLYKKCLNKDITIEITLLFCDFFTV